MDVYDQAATLAKATTAFGDIETAIDELTGIKRKIIDAKRKIDRRKEGSWWLNSLKDFARLLVAFFKGRVRETKTDILRELRTKARELETRAGNMEASADAAVLILGSFTKIINETIAEYTRIKGNTDS